MPTKHSKNCGDRHHFTYAEKCKTGIGSLKQRLGTESQLPFGHCPLTLNPIDDPVVSPSGHIYSREAILEYILIKTQELKEQSQRYEAQTEKQYRNALSSQDAVRKQNIQSFVNSQDGVSDIVDQPLTENEINRSHLSSRKRVFDETDSDIKLEELRRVSPWIVQFTPSADPATIKAPPRRPPSPITGQPLRAKDLIPIHLIREDSETDPLGKSGTCRFICPVSRKTITNQKVILIKSTKTLLLEQTAKELAFPTMSCPLTSRPFKLSDVIEIQAAASGFSASGKVEATKYRPSIN